MRGRRTNLRRLQQGFVNIGLGRGIFGRFDPRTLFRSGEQGGVYDPSDFSTMFQDSAGTTPVTAVEQPVGKILDKSGRGNHRTQATAASRPTLRARYNLLTKTQEFDDTAWNAVSPACTVTPNAIANPINGVVDADLLVPSTGTSFHYRRQLITPAAATYKIRAYAKAGGYNFIEAHIDDGGGQKIAVVFNLTTGAVTQTAGASATSTALSNGWWLVEATGTTTSAMTLVQFNPAPNTTQGTFTGDGTSGVYLWGADVRTATDAALNIPAYQRVNTAADYDTAGFPCYLARDGVDDWDATASVDLSGTNKVTAFIAAANNSLAVNQMLLNFGDVLGADAGSFGLRYPASVAPDAQGLLRGASALATLTTTAITTGAVVLTQLMDLAAGVGVQLGIRKNGAAATFGGANAGAGNFGNFPLYFGRFQGSSGSVNGREYASIILGRAASAREITLAEQWCASKMGLPL